jgi:RDD family
LSEMTDSIDVQRGGFWRRTLAVFIDSIAIGLVLQIFALVLFPVSNGHVQFASGIIVQRDCHPLEVLPDGISVPAEFGANFMTECQASIFGAVTSHTAIIGRQTVEGSVTKFAQLGYMLDRQGKPIHGLALDILVLPLLIALRWGLDRRKGSPGRRLSGIRLLNQSGTASPPTASMINRRYVAFSLPLLPAWIWSAYGSILVDPKLTDPSLFWPIWIAVSIPIFIAGLEAAGSIIRHKDAYYDRIARTCVSRFPASHVATASLVGEPGSAAQNLSDPQGSVPPPLPAGSLPPAVQATGSRNYIMRHWRGELSLPVSYWLNGILGGVVLAVVLFAIRFMTHRDGEARPLVWFLSLAIVWLLNALMVLWQTVGVWRSATRYQKQQKHFWGGLAKGLSVLGMVQLAASFVMVGAPQLAGIYEILSGDRRVGPHQFHIIANGRTLEFSGGITFGVAQEFEGFLNAAATVNAVRLDSIGGRILEAQKIADLIKSRNLTTFVVRECLSACTIVFLGGKERVVLPTARLGFHQPAFRGMTADDRTAAIAIETQRLQRFGLSREFAERANRAAPDDMWFPTMDELVKEQVVTRVFTPPQQTAPNAPPPHDAPSASPATSVSGGSDSSKPADALPFETGRAKLPPDLLKRLSTPPRQTTANPVVK